MTLVAKTRNSKTVPPDRDRRLPRPVYQRELSHLQAELVTLQEWVRAEGARVVVVFEGRDAAGKGSTIKRVAEYLNPRVTRIVALAGTPRATTHTVVLPTLRGASVGGGRDRAV
jgi:polyphosphate kinase 2 (PPK2 family)